MASEGQDACSGRRWAYLRKVLERAGPFSQPGFEPSPQVLDFTMTTCRVLVIGAGGLGCELLKDLALMGFRHLDVIDMDTVELSNLNRQFLFRHRDIGKSKAECAAAFVNRRVAGCQVTAHFCRIQDYEADFYRRFHVVVCGLDSVVARRWINGMLTSLLSYGEDGTPDQASVVPLVDGGTEGFRGNARVVLPGLTACIECTLDLYPPQVTYPLCTIANTPRLPEHCVEYVKVVQWPRDAPFGGAAIDGDDPQHVAWIHEKAGERAAHFGISGLTYRLVQGVVKNIIPAVASTNAAMAAACATEVFKLATGCCVLLNNYLVFNDADGVYTYAYEAERRADCLACSQATRALPARPGLRLRDLVAVLCDPATYNMKSPALTASVAGRARTLYMPGVASIERHTRPNLARTLHQLGLRHGSELTVSDLTSPTALVFRLHYPDGEDGEDDDSNAGDDEDTRMVPPDI